jgi:dTDP-4-amino-4,6-dideoxygalactose transaminase
MKFFFSKEPQLKLSNILSLPRCHPSTLTDELRIETAYSARYALYNILRQLRRDLQDEVIVPGYHCISMVEPICAAGYQILFYDVPNLKAPNLSGIHRLINSRTRAIVVIHYFGFYQDLEELAAECRRKGILLIEDFAHAMSSAVLLTENKKLFVGDVALFSLKKMLPTLDGAFVLYRSALGDLSWKKNRLPVYSVMKNLYRTLESSFRSNLNRFVHRKIPFSMADNEIAFPEIITNAQNGEAKYIPLSYQFMDEQKHWDISFVSDFIWNRANWKAIIAQRRLNYLKLAGILDKFDEIQRPFPNLPDHVCPWALPIIAKSISNCDHRLRAYGIPAFTFGERLHPKLTRTGYEASYYWSENLKLIPIHQDLQPDDMEFVRFAFQKILKSQYLFNRTPETVLS